MTDKQMAKLCRKEALAALKQQDKIEERKNADSEVQRNKAKISNRIDTLVQKRDSLIGEVVELRKVDPESAKLIISFGKGIDDAIRQSRAILAMANSQALQSEIETLVNDSLELMRKLNTQRVDFTPKKFREKIREEKRIHDTMKKLAKEAQMDELSIYTGDITSSDGTGSAFESDVLAAERKAQIDEFDE